MATTDPKALAVPFERKIIGGFTSGKNITIDGIPHGTTDQFSVVLCVGSDFALHYNPRFKQNMAVRVSCVGGKWGQQETDGPMPLKKGQSFTMRIQCEPEFFKIVVNGAEAHKFKHRHQDLGQINSLKIGGDVTLTYVDL